MKTIFAPTTAIVGGVQSPEVDLVVGTFAAVIPVIAINPPVKLYAKGWSNPAVNALAIRP